MASRGDIKSDHVQPALFSGWLTIPFGESIEKTGTFTKLTSKQYNATGNYPVVDQGETFISGYIDDVNLIYKGDLPVIIFGDHTRFVKYINFKFAVGADGTKILKPINALNEKFFYYYIKSLNIPSLGYSRHFSILKTVKIPVPSISEQHRIVAKLDKAFDNIDTLKGKIERIPELIKQFRLQLLDYAISGKLTADWRKNNIQDANDIVKNLKQRTNDSKRLDFFEDIEVTLFDIPKQWTFAYLGALSEKITYGTSVKSENEGDIPVLRMGNLQNGQIDWSDLKYTSDPEELKKYSLNRGDVLFNRTNSPELVGKTSIYESDNQAIYAGYLMKIWNKPELNSYYLNYLLNSAYARNWCWQVKTDGVSQSNINAQKLSKFVVPLPPPDEQTIIVVKLNKLFESAEILVNQFESLRLKINALPQVLLQKAFRGELASHDENDEPVAELLKKIDIDTNTPAPESPPKINASKSMKPKKETQLLIETLMSVSEKNEFTFDDIRKLSSANYSEIKEELYNLLDIKVLEMAFDEENELMIYKLATNETSQDKT